MPKRSLTKIGQETSGNSTDNSQSQQRQSTSRKKLPTGPHAAIERLIKTLIDPDDDPFELGRSFIDDCERRRTLALPWTNYLDNPKVVLFLAGLLLRESRRRRPNAPADAFFQDFELGIPRQAVQYLQQLSRVLASLGQARRSSLAKFSTNLIGSLALKHEAGDELSTLFPRAPGIEKSLLRLGYAYAQPHNYILGDAFPKHLVYQKPTLVALLAGSPSQIRRLTNVLKLALPYMPKSNLPIADVIASALLKYIPLPKDSLFRITLLASSNILCDACGQQKLQFYRNAKIVYEQQSVRLSIFLCARCARKARRPDCTRALARVGFHLLPYSATPRILDVGPTKKAINDPH